MKIHEIYEFLNGDVRVYIPMNYARCGKEDDMGSWGYESDNPFNCLGCIDCEFRIINGKCTHPKTEAWSDLCKVYEGYACDIPVQYAHREIKYISTETEKGKKGAVNEFLKIVLYELEEDEDNE